jgi:hypothetical protein
LPHNETDEGGNEEEKYQWLLELHNEETRAMATCSMYFFHRGSFSRVSNSFGPKRRVRRDASLIERP